MLFEDKPARIASPGTFSLGGVAQYTVGRDHVQEALQSVLERSNGVVAADIETYGLGLAARRIKSVAFCDAPAGEHAVLLDPRDPFQEHLVQWAHEKATKIIYHNAPFDVPNLYINGLIKLDHIQKIWDTLILCRLAEPGMTVPNNLADAMARYLNVPNIKALEHAFKALGLSKEKGYRAFDLDRPIYLQGACEDPVGTARIYPIVMDACYARYTTGHPFHTMALYGDEVWDSIEAKQIVSQDALKRTCIGMRVDFEYLDRYREKNKQDLIDSEKELEEYGIRPGNGQDLVTFLDNLGEIPADFPTTPKTGKWQADQKAIKLLSHPVAKAFARQKEIAKVSNDYLEKVVTLADANGRIHPTTSILKADTGRAAMADPPIHQFPKFARPIVLMDEGDDGTSIDWSQIEPVTMAYWANDETVLDAYESGISDVYTALGSMSGMLPKGCTTAMCEKPELGGIPGYKETRGELKETLLAQLFGEGFPLLTAKLGLDKGPMRPPTDWEIKVRKFDPDRLYPDYAAAKNLRRAVFSVMPRTEEKVKLLKSMADQYQKIITIGGRVLDIPSSIRFGKLQAQSHKGVNYWNQGSAYDILENTLYQCHKQGLSDAVYFTMHDELIVRRDAAHDVRKIMQTPPDRMLLWSKRAPKLRTDMVFLKGHWESV